MINDVIKSGIYFFFFYPICDAFLEAAQGLLLIINTMLLLLVFKIDTVRFLILSTFFTIFFLFFLKSMVFFNDFFSVEIMVKFEIST